MTRSTSGLATITAEDGGLRIEMPARRHWLIVAFLLYWLILYVVLVVETILRTLPTGPPDAVHHLFLGAMTCVAVPCLNVLLWYLLGREVVDIDGTSLTVRKRTPVHTRAFAFEIAQVRDLRASDAPLPPWHSPAVASDPWALSVGRIAFDYGARTCRFGFGLEEAAAKDIVRSITRRYPSLAPRRD